jgi:DNA end-binding protein Ku
VVLNDEDFKKASQGKSESIVINEFVKTEEINPRYFEKPYLLEPEKGSRENLQSSAEGNL